MKVIGLRLRVRTLAFVPRLLIVAGCSLGPGCRPADHTEIERSGASPTTLGLAQVVDQERRSSTDQELGTLSTPKLRAVLTDQDTRFDPVNDGWQTEALSESAIAYGDWPGKHDGQSMVS